MTGAQLNTAAMNDHEMASIGPTSGRGPSAGESAEHVALKHRCAQWLSSRGYRCVATEVRCPIARYRIDVAGHADLTDESTNGPSASIGPLRQASGTVIIECKVSRADFLRNAEDLEALIATRARLEADRLAIEHRILKTNDPDARCLSDSLFPDLESWDFARCRNRSYRDVLRQLRVIHRELYGRTKFHRAARYALADTLLVAAPAGMLRSQEIPEGWGLIEFARAELPRRLTVLPLPPAPPASADSSVAASSAIWQAEPVRFRPAVQPPRPSREEARSRLLRNIAAAATRYAPWWGPPAPERSLEPGPQDRSNLGRPENRVEPANDPADTMGVE